ncbi:MAG: sulfatase-like hydrolase/transferase [Alphaproteobacteria bacterium]|nr:sulfatase-like hydrolase/transferase [Alphaproteobacteria bacterium]
MPNSNVLVLCSDEHARSALGCYGHPVVKTPTLDALAARGARFTRAYTPSPICIPARASLATGLHVHETRCWSSAEPYHGQIESWMHRLRDRGHPVTSIGKLHFRSGDDDNGFDEEIEPMYLANDGLGWPQGLLRAPLPPYNEVTQLASEAGPGESSYTDYDRRVTAPARDWLRQAPNDPDRPWALFVSFVSPHYPLTAPLAFFDLYDNAPIPDPIGQTPDHPVLREMARFWDYDRHFDAATRRLARRCYYGLCSFLDDNIRQVLQALEDSGQSGETTIISISDHGEMLGNHGFWTKSVMYEDSAGIPLIMTGPGIKPRINHTPVSLTDIASTVEHAVGMRPVPARTSFSGRPLQSLLDAPEPDRPILSEYHDGGSPTGFYMLRRRNWKYVHYAGGHPPQLFDLDTDPDELRDLGTNPDATEIRDSLASKLREMLDPEAVNARAFADQARVLASLGGAEMVNAMPSFGHTPLDD